MPMNKLSELSKPVAYIADCGTIVCDSDPFFDDYKSPQPIYSQEYVSDLLADLEEKDRQLKASIRRESAARKGFDEQRERAEASEKFRDQMVKYVRTLGSSVIAPSGVETILNAAERSKAHK
jgi:bifunctional N-acetylglucosamine-1-phosphate-uridyltransferase/glucosamine-1-phosphate-acetyltransferase GlmU-like protein